MNAIILKTFGALIAVAVTFVLIGAINGTASVQKGAPGVGMETVAFLGDVDEKAKANVVPASLPPAATTGQLSIDAYKNVQVLGHITSGEMTRLMTAMTTWVSPKQGCAYCHAAQKDAAGQVVKDEEGYPLADFANMHSDEVYAKRVARSMLKMTMHINSNWQSHVQQTGVTCYTCHRGNPVPKNIWYDEVPAQTSMMMGEVAGQNKPSSVGALSSLPSDVFRTYLVNDENIRVISKEALPNENRASTKQTEWTYGLMMHMSTSLGVNCTYCHNTRSMGVWATSPPTRSVAWYGIRMSRDINKGYIEPLLTTPLPPERLGPMGDVPKLNCATCHQGAYKPLLGVSMLKDYTVLAKAYPQPQKTVVEPTEPIPGEPAPDAPSQPAPAPN